MDTTQNDNTESLEPLRRETGLVRRSGFIARRVRELAQQVRELDLGDEIEVVFPDKNLEAVVREELGEPEGPLTRGELKKLTRLNNDTLGPLGHEGEAKHRVSDRDRGCPLLPHWGQPTRHPRKDAGAARQSRRAHGHGRRLVSPADI